MERVVGVTEVTPSQIAVQETRVVLESPVGWPHSSFGRGVDRLNHDKPRSLGEYSVGQSIR